MEVTAEGVSKTDTQNIPAAPETKRREPFSSKKQLEKRLTKNSPENVPAADKNIKYSSFGSVEPMPCNHICLT